jgi:hypothetical protein
VSFIKEIIMKKKGKLILSASKHRKQKRQTMAGAALPTHCQ